MFKAAALPLGLRLQQIKLGGSGVSRKPTRWFAATSDFRGHSLAFRVTLPWNWRYGVPVSQDDDPWTTWTRRTTPGGWQRLPEVLRAWLFQHLQLADISFLRQAILPWLFCYPLGERNANKETSQVETWTIRLRPARTSSWFTQLPQGRLRGTSHGYSTHERSFLSHLSFIPFRGRFYFGYAPLLAAVEALSALGLTPHLVHKCTFACAVKLAALLVVETSFHEWKSCVLTAIR